MGPASIIAGAVVPQKKEDRAKDRIATRRSQILEAAYDVFATKGYRDTTVADIAQRLGIGHGTFYRYFANKHDVFEQVLVTGLVRVAQSIASEDASSSDSLEAYRAQVRRIGERMLDLLERDPALPRLLFYEAMGISPELDEKIQRMWELAGTFTEAYLRNGKKKGFLRANLDVPMTALAVNAMIFEAGRRVVRAKDRAAVRPRWVDALVSMMFDGIRGG
jgi:AcrR family transcriptional regulator